VSAEPATWPNVRFDYNGAHVLVTGGSSGIGGGIAAAYRDAGAHVTITGTKKSAADYPAEDVSGFDYRRLDVMDNAEIAAVAASLPRLDILVNSAGVAWPKGGAEVQYEPEHYEAGVQMHLTSVYRMCHACLPHLSASKLPGGASILSIASMASFFAIEVVPGYGGGKAGLVQMTKTLGLAWAKHHIRANAVAAGLTVSRMTRYMMDIPEMIDPTLARTPLGRVGTPSDIAGACLFLSSAAAAWMTGQTVVVDGGYSVFG
jgi:3-oxoacyl-[acyl-carrier protein] reductase